MSQLDWIHWGAIVSTVFTGITIVQGWIYFNNNNDKWHLRLLVIVLILLEVVSTCVNGVILRLYSLLPVVATPTSVLASIAIMVNVQTVLTILVLFFVKLFFAFQVYSLNKRSWYAPAAITVCTFGFLACMIFLIVGIERARKAHEPEFPQAKFASGLAFAFSALADLITTVALCWKFSSASTGAKRTQTVLQHLMFYFVTRGVLVTLIEFLHLILFETEYESFCWVPFQMLVCKLYANTTLAMLNARTTLRMQMDADAMDPSRCMPPMHFQNHQTSDAEAQSFIVRPKFPIESSSETASGSSQKDTHAI